MSTDYGTIGYVIMMQKMFLKCSMLLLPLVLDSST